MVSLPVDPLPNISLWSNRIQGVKGDNPILALFWNMHRVERHGLAGRARGHMHRVTRGPGRTRPGPR